MSSTGSVRRTAARFASKAAWGWDSPSPATSSNSTAAAFPSEVEARVAARHLSSNYPWLKRMRCARILWLDGSFSNALKDTDMSLSAFGRFWLAAPIIIVWAGLHGDVFLAQARGGTPQTDKVQPVNNGSNPYRVIRDWAHIEGRAWGGSNGVAI